MTLGLYETPHIHAEHCVGCGLCEQACVQMPQAIRIVPFADLGERATAPKVPSEDRIPKSRWPQGPKWED